MQEIIKIMKERNVGSSDDNVAVKKINNNRAEKKESLGKENVKVWKTEHGMLEN